MSTQLAPALTRLAATSVIITGHTQAQRLQVPAERRIEQQRQRPPRGDRHVRRGQHLDIGMKPDERHRGDHRRM